MPLFAATWQVWPEKKSEVATIFSAMDEKALQENVGTGTKLLGRWGNLAAGTGFAIQETDNVKAMYEFLWKWAEDSMDIQVYPVLDDNQCRELVLGKPPSWTFNYDHVDDYPMDGEVIYLGTYEFDSCEAKMKAYNLFANQTEDDFKAMLGNCRCLGRWHMVPQGKGFVVAAAKDYMDVVGWAYRWAAMSNITIEPVLKDKDAQDIIKAKDGYDKKLAAVMEKLGM